MGRYSVDIEKKAKKQLADVYRSGNKADIKKIEIIIAELEEHPETGTGNPEQLSMNYLVFGQDELTLKIGSYTR